MQAHRGKHRQIQHGNAGALQHQGIVRVTQTQPPTEAEQGHRTGGDTGVAKFHRHHHTFGGVAQQEGQAEKQQHHTDAQHCITAQ